MAKISAPVGRRRRAARLATSAVVLGLLLAACGGGGDDASVDVRVVDDQTPAAILARAADTAATVESGRMKAVAEYDFVLGDRSANATLEMDGSFADGGARSEFTADMASYMQSIAGQVGAGALMPDSMVMTIRQIGTDMYMKFDVDPPEPGTDYWYVTDLAELGGTAGSQGPAGLGGGLNGYVESLRGAGADVVETGTEQLDGVAVTRFEGTIDPEAAVDRAAPDKRAEVRRMLRESGLTEPMPFVAYVDDDGVLRRMTTTMTVSMDGIEVSASMTIDYYDFGADVVIDQPPADQVRDSSELMGQPA